MTGTILAGQQPATDTSPCACWSCDRKCGNSQAGCGPLTAYPRGPICESCAEAADVIGAPDSHQGIKIEYRQAYGSEFHAVVLAADVWGRPLRFALNPAEARQLAYRLWTTASDAERGTR